ncbi:hypothetical protein VNO78_12738 [Psophocarpus tetragonolobus]|uniref:Uncharacterized protein n=1 Tax=Psophocarpus tetragonolobus TaxID=3891 RepID=A0AAN9SWY9_PSOTE
MELQRPDKPNHFNKSKQMFPKDTSHSLYRQASSEGRTLGHSLLGQASTKGCTQGCNKQKMEANPPIDDDKFTVILDLSNDEDDVYHCSKRENPLVSTIPLKVTTPSTRSFAQTEKEKAYGITQRENFTIKLDYSEFRR